MLLHPFQPGEYIAENDALFAAVTIAFPKRQVYAKASDPNHKWITLHPNGSDSTGVHVRVQVNPDGTAHVIHGPGALRGLRLTKLASPEQLKERAKERAAKKRQASQDGKKQDAADRASTDPETMKRVQKRDEDDAGRKGKADELERQMLEKRDHLLKLASDLTGDDTYQQFQSGGDPDSEDEYVKALRDKAKQEGEGETEVKGKAGERVATQNLRRIDSGLKALEKHIVGELVTDDGLRAAVLADGSEVDAEPALGGPKRGTPGYKSNAGEQAAKQGYTRDDARQEADEVWERKVKAIEASDPARAARMREARDTARAISSTARELGQDEDYAPPKPKTRASRSQLAGQSDKVREFLKAQAELKDLQRQARQHALGIDPDATEVEKAALKENDRVPGGADLGVSFTLPDEEFAKRLESQIRDTAAADLTGAFFDAVGQSDPGEEGHADRILRQRMQAHIGVGAHTHLNNALLAITGSDSLDRQVVDVLGVEAAAQLAAHAIRRDSDPDDLDSTREGLNLYHDETSLTRMKNATDLADAARADAAQIDLPPITSTTDAALVASLHKERTGRIAEAHSALGTALGAVEAGAALNLALGQSRNALSVDLGKVGAADAALNLRALGLQDGEYELNSVDGRLHLDINRAGMDRLTVPADAQARKDARTVQRIKDGADDEADYLPAGFARRPGGSFTDHPPVPSNFAAPLTTAGKSHGEIIEEQAGSRYADGWTPREINDHLLSTVARQLPDDQQAAFSEQVAQLLPYAQYEIAKNAQGEDYQRTTFTDLDTDQDVRSRLSNLAQNHLKAKGQPGSAAFHAQTIPDDDHAREALFRSIANTPALQAAFSPPGEIGGTREGRARAQAIKGYFMDRHAAKAAKASGQSVEEYDQSQLAQRDQKLGKLGAEPEKFSSGGGDQGGMFDFGAPAEPTTPTVQFHPTATDDDKHAALREMGLSPEHVKMSSDGHSAELNDAGQKAARAPGARTRISDDPDAPHVASLPSGLNPQWAAHQEKKAQILRDHQPASAMWQDFVESMGGSRRAYQAVQEGMQGELSAAFAHHYASVSGQPLKVSKMTTEHHRKLLAVTDPDKLKAIQAEDRRHMDEHKERVQGRYSSMGEDGARGAADEARRKQEAAQQAQGSMFGAGPDLFGQQGGGEVQADSARHLQPGSHERATLGRAAEARLGQMLSSSRFGVDVKGGPVSLIPDVSWGEGTKHVGKQRAVKALLATGRLGGFLGTGAGKTATQLGGFTEAHARGMVKKGVFVVPSIVRNQFGEEAARFLEPGKYKWHSSEDPDGYAGRMRAYADPDTHMVVSTHQTFRDDMVRAMADHQGVPQAGMAARFQAMSRPERASALKAAMEHHKVPLDFLAMDEAHGALNRAGKKDSLLSGVVEAALDGAKVKSLWTGSPVKNDPSEAYDWLSKLDPQRFQDRDSFMRQYGVDMPASAEALKRLMSGYSYVDAVPAQVDRTVTWGARDKDGNTAPIPLSPQQQAAYEGVHRAYQSARQAKKEGRTDVDAMKTLSPNSFEGTEESDHEGIAERLQGALGTLKHGALARVVNEHPAESNAKIQHVLGLSNNRKGKGGVVFARNKASVQMLKTELEKSGRKVGVIDGSANADQKAQVRRDFDSGKIDMVVASDAGAVGANLQKQGKWLVNYDLPQTQMTLEQRNARIDRQGQTDSIELHHLMTDTDHDRENHARLERKHVLGSILQGQYRSMEDTGLAHYLHAARAERQGDAPYPEAAD
jgi:hypothetical protein